MKQRNQHETPLSDDIMIAWEKWHNPYLEQDGWDDVKPLTGYDEEDFKPQKAKKKDPDYPDWIGNKVVMSPHGIVPITEYNNPTAAFNLWTGHTTFPITHHVLEIVSKCLGVESLDVISPYRMRVGVATLFKPSTVCSEIAKKLSFEIIEEAPTLLQRVQELRDGEENQNPTT